MLLTGYIFNSSTGDGIPFANIYITDQEGENPAHGTESNQDGYFTLDSPLLDSGGWLLVSSAGYQPVLVAPGVYQDSSNIGLDISGNLAPVVYTQKLPKKEQDYLIPLLVGGGLLAVLLMQGEKRKRVKGVTALQANEWLGLAIKIGIPVLIYFVVVQPLLQKLGILPDKKKKQQNASDQAAAQEQGQLANYNAQENHTYNKATLDSVAVALRMATADWWGYEWRDLARQLAYIPGFTAADARYFLGTFVDKNGYTLYQWFYQEFEDALVFKSFDWDDVYWNPGFGGTGTPYDYRQSYQKMGINEQNAGKYSWTNVVRTFVSYVYQVANVTMQ